jgi:hypothetical protein
VFHNLCLKRSELGHARPNEACNATRLSTTTYRVPGSRSLSFAAPGPLCAVVSGSLFSSPRSIRVVPARFRTKGRGHDARHPVSNRPFCCLLIRAASAYGAPARRDPIFLLPLYMTQTNCNLIFTTVHGNVFGVVLEPPAAVNLRKEDRLSLLEVRIGLIDLNVKPDVQVLGADIADVTLDLKDFLAQAV